MNCDERQLAISMMIDNECPIAELQGLFTHLGECPRCLQFHSESMEIRTRLHRERVPSVSSSVDARILAHARGRTILRMPAWMTSRIAIPAPLAAAALVLIILGTFSLLSQRPTQSPSLAEREIVYVTTLPVVEIEGIVPNAPTRRP
jgi:anti-sigma factor RsiW